MEFFDFQSFLSDYKIALGSLSIASATIIAVYLNYVASLKNGRRLKHENTASFAAAIASELADNADNLTELYFEIENKNLDQRKIAVYQDFHVKVYEALLEQIGNFGSALSYMVVDVYGDLNKLSLYLELARGADIQSEQDELQYQIKRILSKTITTSVIILLYSDRLNGRSYVREIHQKRTLWVERTLYKFCTYVSEAEEGFEFIDQAKNPKGEFAKRLVHKEDRTKIRYLIHTIEKAVKKSNNNKVFRASLILRALSYEIHDVLKYFLKVERNHYDLNLQEEYSSYLED